ncbi:MAG: hydroxymethylbilane synthase [Aestuariivita sp.]|nr:hydroxymethylbilane synthase [Aestuariivita sp.]
MTLKLPSPLAPLKIGTRGSPLALAQANEAATRIINTFQLPIEAIEIVIVKVMGDVIQDRPLREIGGKGLFTREIEEDLLANKIDIAVHSMKDMPVEQPPGLILNTYLPREDVRDAFVSLDFNSISELPDGATIGTSSLRRKAQILNKRPDLNIVEFRGNVQTRLRKLSEGIANCTFLAMAGLKRLDLEDDHCHPIHSDEMLPAVAQGAIGIERRATDLNTAHLLEAVHDKATEQSIATERAFLAELDGSCATPIAGLAELNGTHLRLRGEILRPDGSDLLSDDTSGSISDGPKIGKEMAEKLLSLADPNFFKF